MSQTQQELYIGGNVIEPSPAFKVMQGITEGSIPTNENMVSSLKEMEESLKMHADQGKGPESRFAHDAQRFIRHAREMIEEKNKDDAIRTMVLHIKEASELLAEAVPEAGAKIAAKGEALMSQESSQLQHLVDSFKSLVFALGRNADLRVRFIDIIQLMEESMSQLISAAVQLEEKVEEKTDTKPSGEASKKMEEMKEKAASKKPMTATQVREKLRGMMIELGSTPEYKEFMNSVSTFFQTNWQYLSTLLDESAVSNKTYIALMLVISDVQTLLERFSGGKSLNKLRTSIYDVLVTVSKDKKLNQLISRWRDFIKKTIEKPEDQEFDMEALDKELMSLIDAGKDLVKKEKLQENLGSLIKETKGFVERFTEDSGLKKVGKDIDHIRKGFLTNEKGTLDMNTLKNSLPTLKNVLIPTLTAALRNIPIPTITVDNEKYFFQLSNLSLSAQDLIPEKIRIHFTNDVVFDFSTEGNDRFISRLTVLMRDFNASLRDINFKYDRKKMPQISDFGVADVDIVGIDIDIRWRMEMNDSSLCFYIDYVKCLIDTLRTNIKEANHKMLDNIYLTLFSGGMKTSLEETIEETLRDKLIEFNIDTSAPLSEQIPIPIPQA
jgi:hypothetical protein